MLNHGSPDREGAAVGDAIKVGGSFAHRADRLDVDREEMAVPLFQKRVVPVGNIKNEASLEGHSPIVTVGEQEIWHE